MGQSPTCLAKLCQDFSLSGNTTDITVSHNTLLCRSALARRKKRTLSNSTWFCIFLLTSHKNKGKAINVLRLSPFFFEFPCRFWRNERFAISLCKEQNASVFWMIENLLFRYCFFSNSMSSSLLKLILKKVFWETCLPKLFKISLYTKKPTCNWTGFRFRLIKLF